MMTFLGLFFPYFSVILLITLGDQCTNIIFLTFHWRLVANLPIHHTVLGAGSDISLLKHLQNAK